jgi:hypothetical protein
MLLCGSLPLPDEICDSPLSQQLEIWHGRLLFLQKLLYVVRTD